ncbi:Uncharacterised protein g5799 [Pycnogonum litorale]
MVDTCQNEPLVDPHDCNGDHYERSVDEMFTKTTNGNGNGPSMNETLSSKYGKRREKTIEQIRLQRLHETTPSGSSDDETNDVKEPPKMKRKAKTKKKAYIHGTKKLMPKKLHFSADKWNET